MTGPVPIVYLDSRSAQVGGVPLFFDYESASGLTREGRKSELVHYTYSFPILAGVRRLDYATLGSLASVHNG